MNFHSFGSILTRYEWFRKKCRQLAAGVNRVFIPLNIMLHEDIENVREKQDSHYEF